MNVLFCLGAAIGLGLLFNRISKKIGLPNVTGYLVAGLLIGPYALNIFPDNVSENFAVITDFALGFIAFSIGGEFKFSVLKDIGKSVLIITLFQALAATLFVDVVLILIGAPIPIALTLGAIATATAPAATLMVVRQYNAHGPVTNMLLPVVALDDAVGLAVFSVSISLAKAFASGANLSVGDMLLAPLTEIFGSLIVGFVLGALLTFFLRFFQSRSNRLTLIICVVVMGIALSQMFHLSSLLLCMCIGMVLVNLYGEAEKMLDVTDHWTPVVLLLFFVISGAELDFSVLPQVGLIGVLYLIFRSLGKYFGAFAGSAVVKADKNIRNYLGIALLPQAGVAIGMAQIAITALPEHGTQVRAVVLCATLVYEILGPMLTKIVLTKAGEIVPEKKNVKPNPDWEAMELSNKK